MAKQAAANTRPAPAAKPPGSSQSAPAAKPPVTPPVKPPDTPPADSASKSDAIESAADLIYQKNKEFNIADKQRAIDLYKKNS